MLSLVMLLVDTMVALVCHKSISLLSQVTQEAHLALVFQGLDTELVVCSIQELLDTSLVLVNPTQPQLISLLSQVIQEAHLLMLFLPLEMYQLVWRVADKC
jgi:hypothetical protein